MGEAFNVGNDKLARVRPQISTGMFDSLWTPVLLMRCSQGSSAPFDSSLYFTFKYVVVRCEYLALQCSGMFPSCVKGAVSCRVRHHSPHLKPKCAIDPAKYPANSKPTESQWTPKARQLALSLIEKVHARSSEGTDLFSKFG